MRWWPVLLLTLAACGPEPAVRFDDARIREPVPGRSITAAYMTVTSRDQDVTITGASSGAAGRIEFHETIDDDGIMRMRQLEQLTLKAGVPLKLESGGAHLMVFDVGELPRTVEITFTTETQGSFKVPFRRVAVGEAL